ncbi:MAG: DUF4097 family beta strand repeat-containing protein, partial [Ignavibacteria bacterium]
PGRFNTDIHTSGGDIKLAQVEGTIEMQTSGGDVVCNDFLGSLDVSTSGGDIKLNGGNTPIIAHTSGGDITLDHFGVNKGIDLSTSGGDVGCNITMNNANKLSDLKIVAELNDGGPGLIAHTSGGDIDVRKKD